MHLFSVSYVSQTLFGIYWWYLVVMKSRTKRHVTYKNDNFCFFYFWLSPLLVFDFDFLSSLCNTNTLWNILMMLNGTNVEQDEMTCCVQEWQLGRYWGDICFFSKNPFLFQPLSCWINWNAMPMTFWNIFLIFSRKKEWQCKLSPSKETIWMKCRILFFGKNKKNIISLSSAENA